MRLVLGAVGLSVALAICPVSAGLASGNSRAYGAKSKPRLPFQTVAKGASHQAPFVFGPPTPASLIAGKHSGFVYVNAYAGLFDASGYDMSVKTVSVVSGRLQLRAELVVPALPGLGFSSPYQFIRIKRSLIAGKLPQSAYLVQVEQGLKAHTSIARLASFAKKMGGRLVSATLVRRFETITPWTQGGPVGSSPPVWYLRCVGNLHFGMGLAPTGFYLVDDQSGQGFGGGFP